MIRFIYHDGGMALYLNPAHVASVRVPKSPENKDLSYVDMINGDTWLVEHSALDVARWVEAGHVC